MSIIYKTIKTKRNYYVYDRNKNSIIRISKNEYDELNSLEDKLEEISESEIVRKFQNEGFLLESQLKYIENPMSIYKEHIIRHHRDQLILQVTQRCNLRCEYCIYSEKGEYHNRTHSNKDMSTEIAEKSIDDYLEASIESPERVVAFYGGEPLLKIDLIKHCVEYVKKRNFGKPIRFVMTSNGTLLTLEIAKFLYENNFQLLISLDGSRDAHNEYRKFANGTGSFDTIMKNLSVIKQELPEFYKTINFNTVLNPKHNYEKIKAYFEQDELVADATVMHSLVEENDDGTNINFSDIFYKIRQYDYFIMLLYMLRQIDYSCVSKFVRAAQVSIIRRYEQVTKGGGIGETNHPSGPCFPGGRRTFVNVYGDIYPCEKVSETCPDVKLGNIDTGIDLKKVDKLLNIGKMTEAECKKCWAFLLCDICCKKAEDGVRLCAKAKLKHCADTRYRAYLDLKDICILNEYGCKFELEEV